MQRSSVDLPEPEAPISATASCSPTVEVDPPQHLVVAVGLGDAAQLEDRGHRGPSASAAPRSRRLRACRRSTIRVSGIVTHR